MKRKCRVYNMGGGTKSYQTGGPTPQQNASTQDSTPGSVPQEKANNFMNWLHSSSNNAQVEQMVKQDAELLDEMAKWGGTPEYQIGGTAPMQSGFQTGDYGEMNPMNMSAYAGAYDNSDPNMIGNLDVLGRLGAGAIHRNQLKKAQSGVQQEISYPDGFTGLDPLMDESILAEGLEAPVPGAYDWNAFTPPAPEDPVFGPDPGAFGQGDEMADDGSSESGRKGVKNPYALPQGIIAGANVLAGIGGMDERLSMEEQLREKQSDVFQNFATVGPDRGDYTVNAPGIGTNFRPDQTTRYGYNTNMAQDGYQVEDEIELTESQINNLIEQGYDLEYLD